MGRKYKFTEKTHSKRALLSVIAAAASIGIFALTIIYTMATSGGENIYLGAAGIFALLVAIVSFVLAFNALREEDSFRVLPMSAIVLAVIACLLWIATYGIGLS